MTHQTPDQTTTPPATTTPPRPSPQPASLGTDRRAVLRAACGVCAVAAGGALLAACGGGGSDAATLPRTAGSSAAGTTAGTTTSGGTSSGATAATSPTAGSGIPTSEIPVGGGSFFPAQKLVITQPVAGTFKAFDTTCPHQQNPVSVISGDVIVCTFHGSTFNLATGAHVAGPAPRGLTPKSVTVSGDRLIVS